MALMVSHLRFLKGLVFRSHPGGVGECDAAGAGKELCSHMRNVVCLYGDTAVRLEAGRGQILESDILMVCVIGKKMESFYFMFILQFVFPMLALYIQGNCSTVQCGSSPNQSHTFRFKKQYNTQSVMVQRQASVCEFKSNLFYIMRLCL